MMMVFVAVDTHFPGHDDGYIDGDDNGNGNGNGCGGDDDDHMVMTRLPTFNGSYNGGGNGDTDVDFGSLC